MPWTTDSPPSVAKNWSDEEKRKCVEAANAALRDGASDEQAIFACIRAAGRSEASMESFLFTELEEDALTDGRAFDGVAFGTFNDMLGREITLEPDDAESYVANTQAAIEATRAESGELVGLPIDAKGHEKGDGAGWIVGVELVNGIVRFIPKWTEIGRELIGKGIRRFFSATIDITNKVVIGGTLTNWPATRDAGNKVMLRPIELESKIYVLDSGDESPPESAEVIMAEKEEVPKEEVADVETQQAPTPKPQAVETLAPDVTAQLMAEFAQAGSQEPIEIVEAIARRANQLAQIRVEEMQERRQREFEVTNLASQFTGGRRYGIPVGVLELAQFLDSLDGEQYQTAIGIFDNITKNGVVEFTERGHGRLLRKKQLPDEYHAAYKEVLAAGNSPADFFEAVELGNPDDYDLSMFNGGSNG